MIIRDEAVNLLTNIPLWKSIKGIDYFSILVDNRTIDNSAEVILSLFSSDRESLAVVGYYFVGFGPARSLALDFTYNKFPQADYVWIVDPDWVPVVDTIKIEELDPMFDAFRFKIHDRNGNSIRNCDWLLRNRKGLKMRYNLHEVLDIGDYSLKIVKFVVHEIEKPGTWHTTVGHGNSMSFERYLFDLNLLYEDLEQYGHEAHVDYYLCVTHAQVATELYKQFPWNNTIFYHVNQTLHFCNLRSVGIYAAELGEERLASMLSYSRAYFYFLGDLFSAERWLKACIEFKSSRFECYLTLFRLYQYAERTDDLVELAITMLKVHETQDYVTNFHLLARCSVPLVVIEAYTRDARFGSMLKAGGFYGSDFAQYVILLVIIMFYIPPYVQLSMARDVQCAVTNQYNRVVSGALVDELVYALSLNGKNKFCTLETLYMIEIILDGELIKLSSTSEFTTLENATVTICSKFSVSGFVANREFTILPCKNVFYGPRKLFPNIFLSRQIAPVEELQVAYFGEFLGAASLYEMLSYGFGGTLSSAVCFTSNSIKLLFASHYNVNMVVNFIGGLRLFDRSFYIEIHMLVKKMDVDRVKNVVEYLMRFRRNEMTKVSILEWEDVVADWNNFTTFYDSYFQYIEYYGNFKSTIEFDLSKMFKVLSPNGVIGMTYFVNNIHVMLIKSLLENRNITHFPPFSTDSTRIIRGYLNTYFPILAKDDILIDFLASEGFDSNCFLYDEIQTIVDNSGFEILAQLPKSRTRPFENIQDYSVQRFADMGISEEYFVYSQMPSFRNTLYIRKASKNNLRYRVNIDDDIIVPYMEGKHNPLKRFGASYRGYYTDNDRISVLKDGKFTYVIHIPKYLRIAFSYFLTLTYVDLQTLVDVAINADGNVTSTEEITLSFLRLCKQLVKVDLLLIMPNENSLFSIGSGNLAVQLERPPVEYKAFVDFERSPISYPVGLLENAFLASKALEKRTFNEKITTHSPPSNPIWNSSRNLISTCNHLQVLVNESEVNLSMCRLHVLV